MKRYPEETKQQIYQRYLSGDSALALSKELGISLSSVYVWIRKQKVLAVKKLSDCTIQEAGAILRHMEEQEGRLRGLEQELDIIHSSGLLQKIPMSKRMAVAIELSDTYVGTQLCKAFELDQSTFYHHRRRKNTKSKHQQDDEALSSVIRQIYESNEGRIGSKRILFQLKTWGIHTSQKRVIRLMKEMNLYSQKAPAPYYMPEMSASSEETVNVKIL